MNKYMMALWKRLEYLFGLVFLAILNLIIYDFQLIQQILSNRLTELYLSERLESFHDVISEKSPTDPRKTM
jgi:sensor domain CHASE-containing protein